MLSETDKISELSCKHNLRWNNIPSYDSTIFSCNKSCSYIFSEQQKIRADYTNDCFILHRVKTKNNLLKYISSTSRFVKLNALVYSICIAGVRGFFSLRCHKNILS